MICDGCGHELPDNAKFCLECGKPVTGAAPADGPHGNGQGDDGPATASTAAKDEAAVPAGDGAAGGPASDGDIPDATPEANDAAPEATDAPANVVPSGAGEVPPTQPIPRATPAPVPDDLEDTREAPRPDLSSPVDTAPFPGEPGPVYRAERPGKDDGKGPKDTSRLGLITAAALFAGAVVLLIAFVTWRMEVWGGRTLPDTVGMTQAEATAALQDEGFSVATTEVVSDDAVGKVVTQEPAGGRRVEEGTVVALGVGIERAVPDVEGMDVDAARDALGKREIVRLRVEYENSDEAEGTVISVSPEAGTVVTEDDVVTLVVAQPYTVPDVTGLTADEATTAIERAGLSAKQVLVASDKDPGTVVSTDPAAGATLKEGAAVTVSVSSPYPASPYAVAEYLTCRPQDLSTYLREEGYSMAYGASRDNAATMTWEGPKADPTVVIGPNPFARYRGFQFWATDALAAGAEVKGVRVEMNQESAPKDAGTLKVDQTCVSSLMNACGLRASADTTTVATPDTVVPANGSLPSFVAKAGTMGADTWAVVVWDAGGGVRAAVCAAPTTSLEEALKKDSVDMGAYDGSMANAAATLVLTEAVR